MGIKENYQNIREKTPKARIIAVTKNIGPEKILEAYNSGIRDFGENRIQDIEKKRADLPEEIDKSVVWHFIGHLQTNKVKNVVGKYEYIHSVDSVKLAKYISEAAKSLKITQSILIQINIAEEETKYGFTTEQIKKEFGEILGLDSISIKGLMTIAPNTQDKEIQKEVFKGLKDLRNSLETEYKTSIPELSMGMSNDYEVAYEQGATIIRLGYAIFKNKL